MESDALRLDFPILHIDLVAAQDYWYAFAHSDEIPMPVWYILVGRPRCHIEHDDGALTCCDRVK